MPAVPAIRPSPPSPLSPLFRTSFHLLPSQRVSRISSSGEDFIEWIWNAVEEADGYDVQFSVNEVFTDEAEIIARTAQELVYRRQDLAAETSAYVRVRSASGSGDDRITSDWSAHVTGMTAEPPPFESRFIRPYGELVRSMDCPEFEIPEGFRCIRLGSGGVASSVRDGLAVPNAFDGMCAFPLPNGNVRLIRNHEMIDPATEGIAIGDPHYDSRASGGTTSLEVRISEQDGELAVELVDEFVSLAGTLRNCAGGPTPWGSWLSCEETIAGPESGYDKPHGYVYEVPVDATGPVDPVAAARDGTLLARGGSRGSGYGDRLPDRGHGGPRRFLSLHPGHPRSARRRRQTSDLAVTDQPGYDTREGQTPGTVLPVHWVDIADPERAAFHLGLGLAAGAARFNRLEGITPGDSGMYFVSSGGGDAQSGQVFHYLPTSAAAGELRLVFESPSPDILDQPDNMTMTPEGGVLLCEDGFGEQLIRELDGEGRLVNLVRSVLSAPEFAGPCFSPDGRVLFFNVQGSWNQEGTRPSGTYALW